MTTARDLEQDIDRGMSGVFGWMGRNLKRLVLIGLVLAVLLWFVLPIWQQVLPLVGYGALMLFQMAFAVMFMIIQFVAIFWFLGRPRIYWTKPGETGIGFADYKGNPEVLES